MSYSKTLSHKAQYSGGFKQVNGRSNNTAAYNHNYYQQNKELWKTKYGRSAKVSDDEKRKAEVTRNISQQEKDFLKDVDEYLKKSGRDPEEFLKSQDFRLTLAEFGGYDPDKIRGADVGYFTGNYRNYFGIKGEEDEYLESKTKGDLMTGGMPTSAKDAMTEAYMRKARQQSGVKPLNRGNRMGNGMPSNIKKKKVEHSDASNGEYYAVSYSSDLSHHGILGQKWGKRNGPPYPLGGGDYTPAENRAIYRERKLHKNSIYNKKHFDKTVKVGTNFATLSYDKDRTKGADMFYAAYSNADKHQYNALFNKKVPQELYDEKGNNIGTGNFYKYRIQNTARKDVKVASEDSGAKMFMNLYKRDRDFYNFVTDPDRMQSHFVDSKYKFKGYREARDTLEKMREPGYKPTEDDMKKVYRMYNYTIPSDGGGDSRRGGDVAKQRAKFFKELKGNGYGAVLDTNDAIYGAFKAQAPVIVFDMESIALKDAERVTTGSKLYSDMVFAGRKAIGL